MKKVPIDQLKNGLVIAENIKDSSGKLLVGAGTTVTTTIIIRLEDSGLKGVMVLEPGEKAVSVNEGMKFLEQMKDKYGTIKNLNTAISEKDKKEKPAELSLSSRISTEQRKPVVVIKKTSAPIKEKKDDDAEEMKKVLKDTTEALKKIIVEAKENGSIIPFNPSEELLKMLNSILVKKDVLTVLMKMKKHDEYLYQHALYCGLMGMTAAEVMGYQKIVMFSMGLGGLMMDSGMMEIPKEITEKKAVLKPEEREIVKKHTAKSYAIVGSISQTTDTAKEIALYHHERIDGAGYPKGKKNDEISDYTKIMNIIDVYHALISERPYHQKKNNKEAFYAIFMYKGKQFDEKILAELIKKNSANK